MIENKKYYNKYNKAFTLVEIMIAIMLTTIVLTSIFLIWSRVQQGIARSHTRQTLQNELRKAANYFQNDLKSIKYDENTFKFTDNSSGNFSLNFEKFKEIENDKLAQDSIEKVKYEKKNTLLTRIGDKTNILSSHCLEVNIAPSNDSSVSGVNGKAAEDYKAGREAKLEITIIGKKTVPGTGEEIFHTEKTSVVMRNEYNKAVNKTYVSNFDLSKKNVDEVVVAGDSKDLKADEKLGLEYLLTLDDQTLEGLGESQKQLLQQAKDNLKDVNGQIDNTDDGQGVFGDVIDTLCFWSESENEKYNKQKNELVKADSVSEVNEVVKDIRREVEDKEKDFYRLSIPDYHTMHNNPSREKELEVYKKAYDMAVHDKAIKDAYDKLLEEAGNDEAKKAEIESSRPISNWDTISGHTKLEGNKIVKTDELQEVSDDTKEIAEAYEKINLAWMDDSKYEDDLDIYKARKSLLDQADTKIELLKVRDVAQENVKNIEYAIAHN